MDNPERVLYLSWYRKQYFFTSAQETPSAEGRGRGRVRRRGRVRGRGEDEVGGEE